MKAVKTRKLWDDLDCQSCIGNKLGNEIDVELTELERLASYQVPITLKAELYISTRCPSCRHDLSEHIDDGYHKVNKVKFCPNCGQALKWE